MTSLLGEIHVLVVEDVPADAELVILQLENGGYTVTWERVASAAELRAALAAKSWDVVISDYGMQGFDAPAALAIVRETVSDLPFIIVSGSVGEELAVRAMKAGAHDFFLKDHLERLPAAIAREVGEARLRAERRDALDRLHASEEQRRVLLDQVIVGIFQTEPKGRFIYANQRFCEITGRSNAELLSLRERDITHPDDVATYEASLDRAREETHGFVLAKRYLRPNGVEVWVNASVSVIATGSGQPHVVGVVDDITDRRRAERERERLVADLERTVKVSEMFIGVLGHDLRNPLQTITMAAALLRRGETKEIEKNAARIAKAGERMRRMIDQLLDFTRMRIGMGIPLAAQELDLGEIARLAIDEIAVGSESSELDLVLEGSTRGSWDRDRLFQLISNLLANAVDHREPGSIVRVRVDGRRAAWVKLEVQNRGVIPPAILPNIFEPLQTTKRNKQDRASGLGLGLFITRQIARAHGGTVYVESDPSIGTRFVVELPRELATSESTPAVGSSSFDLPPPATQRPNH